MVFPRPHPAWGRCSHCIVSGCLMQGGCQFATTRRPILDVRCPERDSAACSYVCGGVLHVASGCRLAVLVCSAPALLKSLAASLRGLAFLPPSSCRFGGSLGSTASWMTVGQPACKISLMDGRLVWLSFLLRTTMSSSLMRPLQCQSQKSSPGFGAQSSTSSKCLRTSSWPSEILPPSATLPTTSASGGAPCASDGGWPACLQRPPELRGL